MFTVVLYGMYMKHFPWACRVVICSDVLCCRKACKLLWQQTSQWRSLIISDVCCSFMADTGLLLTLQSFI